MAAGENLTTFLDSRYPERTALTEWPVSRHNQDGQVPQGWIDLLLETPRGFVILDHKDYPGGDVLVRMKQYIRQLAVYRSIL